MASLALHLGIVALALTVAWEGERPTTFINLVPPATPVPRQLPPFGGTRRGRGPSGGLGHPAPAAPTPPASPAPAPIGKPDTTLAASPAPEGPHLVTPPAVADGRLWVSPRPALPADVADELYGDHDRHDSVAIGRLRAMVDTLNRVIDSEQLARRLPSWTKDVAGAKFGLDPQYIYIAGIRIPTPVLALLGSLLPQGNYDENLRSRQLEDMRQDLLQAARRTETLQQFRQYVKELRARKQAERDALKRARGDTVTADTVKAVP